MEWLFNPTLNLKSAKVCRMRHMCFWQLNAEGVCVRLCICIQRTCSHNTKRSTLQILQLAQRLSKRMCLSQMRHPFPHEWTLTSNILSGQGVIESFTLGGKSKLASKLKKQGGKAVRLQETWHTVHLRVPVCPNVNSSHLATRSKWPNQVRPRQSFPEWLATLCSQSVQPWHMRLNLWAELCEPVKWCNPVLHSAEPAHTCEANREDLNVLW